MKHWLAAVALICFGSGAQASPYYRLIGAGNVQQSASIAFSPIAPPIGMTDLGIFTHSTADGSIMPEFCRSTWCPPENNAFTVGGGGNPKIVGGKLSGTAVVTAGWSTNLAPQLSAWAVQGISASSPAWLQGVKAAMLNTDGNGVRIGVGLYANAINDGTIQSFKEMFPGRGLGNIIKNSGRIAVGYGWRWK